MSKHTLGPWEHEATEQVQSGLSHMIIGPVNNPIGWAYRAGDAKLMAASPELFAALKWIMRSAAKDDPLMWSYAIDAIKKAEACQ